MQPLPELRAWKQDVDPEFAEQRVRWLREQIAAADDAIAAQNRIIATDGGHEAYTLLLASLKASQRELENDLAEQMHQREFEIFDFALDGPPFDAHRAGAKALSKFLDRLQRLFERVGQAMATARYTPVVPQHIRDACSLEIAGFYPSSFGIRFTTRTCADLTGNSVASTALDATFDLINSEQPAEQAAKLGNVVLTNYRNLVKTLVEVDASPKAKWKTPDGATREWERTPSDLHALYNRLAKIHNLPDKTVETTGFLEGASLHRHKFELNCQYGMINGKAPAELADKVKECFGKPVRAVYVETTFIDESTDQKKHSRTLIDIDTI